MVDNATALFRAIVKVTGSYTEGRKTQANESTVEKILQSNLLSGGMSQEHLNKYSDDSVTNLKAHAQIIGEPALMKSLQFPDSKDTTDSVIHAGTEEDYDLLIEFLQKSLLRPQTRMKFSYCMVGGELGVRVTRAAFAIMLKYSDLSTDFEMLALDIAG